MQCYCGHDIEDGEWNRERTTKGERECAEMQIFARKLITRINSSQNIQTGCQTVRLYTPIPGYEPNTAYPPDAVHALAGVTRARHNAYITCSPVLSAPANWLQIDSLDDFISIPNHQKLLAILLAIEIEELITLSHALS